MKIEQLLTGVVGLTLIFTPHVYADAGSYARNPASSYYISAPVLHVDPITTQRTINNPVRHCTNAASSRRGSQGTTRRSADHYYDSRHDYRYDSHQNYDRHEPRENYFLPGLFGGILGGLIGNQFGGGSGKKALTIVGALAGSSIARDTARSRHRTEYPTQVCTTRYETQVLEDISAYDVTYEYGGQQFSRRMQEHPGETVRVRVEIAAEHDYD